MVDDEDGNILDLLGVRFEVQLLFIKRKFL
jgi:hypothetical protein